MMRHMLGAVAAVAVVAFALASGALVVPAPARADVYAEKVEPALAVVVTAVPKSAPDAIPLSASQSVLVLGTAFCIYSQAQSSYFLTAYHVVNTVAPISILLLKSPAGPNRLVAAKKLWPQTVEPAPPGFPGEQWPDVALLRADVGNLPTVSLDPRYPDPLQVRDVMIAGFPVLAIDQWRKCAAHPDMDACEGSWPQPVSDNAQVKTNIAPWLIAYQSGGTDRGNSGSPLFNKDSGVVYGVVVQGGVHLPESLPDISYDLAVSLHIIVKKHPDQDELRLAIAPDVPGMAVQKQGYSSRTWSVDQTCDAGLDLLSKGYGDWLVDHMALHELYRRARSASDQTKYRAMAAAAPELQASEGAALATVDKGLHTIQAGRISDTSAAAAGLAQAIHSADEHDGALVRTLVAAAGSNALPQLDSAADMRFETSLDSATNTMNINDSCTYETHP